MSNPGSKCPVLGFVDTSGDKQLTKKKVKEIVREEIHDQEMKTYLYSLMTGNDFNMRLRNSLDCLLEQKLSPAVSREVSDYLRTHLEAQIKSVMMTNLPFLINPMVTGEVTRHLNSLSGVSELLQSYHQSVQRDLQSHLTTVQEEREGHLRDLQQIKTTQHREFENLIKHTAQGVVDRLVGSNGQVIQGFANELQRQNLIHKNNLALELRGRQQELESSLSTFKWITASLFVAFAGTLAYVTLSR